MNTRFAFVDEVLYSKEFNTGDCVRKTGLRDFVLTPYAGRVLYSDTDTGVVVVQWPWGAENNYPSELVIDKSGDFGTPNMDQSYSTWESTRYKDDPDTLKNDVKWRKSLASDISEEFSRLTLPIYKAACKAWYQELPEMEVLVTLSSIYSPKYGFEPVRKSVDDVYSSGRRIAIYWGSSNRKYRVTQSEMVTGKYKCPRCGNGLKPRTFRHLKRLMSCGGPSGCGFSIHNKDLLK